jgi:hypothetical protein
MISVTSDESRMASMRVSIIAGHFGLVVPVMHIRGQGENAGTRLFARP